MLKLPNFVSAPIRFLAAPKKRNHRVAVIGLFNSGKTVLTTALINHLQEHNWDELQLQDRKTKVELEFNEKKSLPDWLPKDKVFPYSQYRARLSTKWPRKTLETAGYACSFYANDRECSLLIVDVAGERYGDFTMVNRSFRDWSKYLLEEVFQKQDYSNEMHAYNELLCSDTPPNEKAILNTYREALAKLFLSYRPIITPSTFLLTHAGGKAQDKDTEEKTRYLGRDVLNGTLTDCVSGLNRESEFAPLPESFRASHPEIYERFSQSYETYKEEVVTPIRRAIEKATHLVVLVDITGLLATNTARKNGAVAITKELLDAVRPGRTFLQRSTEEILSYLWGGKINGSGIRRVTFVATKADKVLNTQHSHMTKLLKDMMGKLIKPHLRKKALDVAYLTVSAVCASEQLPNHPGKKTGVPKGRDIAEVFTPSSVPNRWPSGWREGEFNFPDVEPRFPANEQRAPAHIYFETFVSRVLELS